MSRRYRVRPNPVGSFFGGLVALGMVGVGLFIVIPAAGAFGVVWTLFAAVGAILSFYNAFSQRGIASEIIETSDDDDSREPTTTEARLQRLHHLKAKGLITPSEYEDRRTAILSEL